MKRSRFYEDTNVPSGFGTPSFGVGDATAGSPTPDTSLQGESGAAIDTEPGFSLGGAQDPLAEEDDGIVADDFAPASPDTVVVEDDPYVEPELPVVEGKGCYSEDFYGSADGEYIDPVAEDGTTFGTEVEENNDFPIISEDDIPEFDNYEEDEVVADLAVDGAGIVEPEIVDIAEDDDIELGAIPDTELPMTEPIVTVDEDDDEYLTQEDLVDDAEPEPIIVETAFQLPEARNIVVNKGDHIYFIGKASTASMPKFCESTFKKAVKALTESKYPNGASYSFSKGNSSTKVALIGRSCLVEAAADWRIPGTSHVVEKHDILQIVSMKPISEAEQI